MPNLIWVQVEDESDGWVMIQPYDEDDENVEFHQPVVQPSARALKRRA